MPNQWIVFFARSDWLLKLGIVSAIYLPDVPPGCSSRMFLPDVPPGIFLDFAGEFPLVSQKKRN